MCVCVYVCIYKYMFNTYNIYNIYNSLRNLLKVKNLNYYRLFEKSIIIYNIYNNDTIKTIST